MNIVCVLNFECTFWILCIAFVDWVAVTAVDGACVDAVDAAGVDAVDVAGVDAVDVAGVDAVDDAGVDAADVHVADVKAADVNATDIHFVVTVALHVVCVNKMAIDRIGRYLPIAVAKIISLILCFHPLAF